MSYFVADERGRVRLGVEAKRTGEGPTAMVPITGRDQLPLLLFRTASHRSAFVQLQRWAWHVEKKKKAIAPTDALVYASLKAKVYCL
jgi:hypothetical protein